MRSLCFVLATAFVSLSTTAAFATTYQVGPTRSMTSLHDVESILQPGDVVEVDGDATYGGDIHIRPASSGTGALKITIRGVLVNGKRPTISGGASYGIVLHGNHTIFENFEVTGSQGACVIDKADDLTLRNLHIHDCPGDGILGMDTDAGSQTIEYNEIDHCGSGLYSHQLYLANDQTLYPSAVMRVQFNYIHDGAGGNSLKSRGSRNEIYGNWIENSAYHLLDLIGADEQDHSLAREDSDVVGNVLIQANEYQIARIGGDKDTATSGGRYRFAYNTIVVSPTQSMLFRLNLDVESVAIHDNVFVMPNGGAPTFVDDTDAIWTTGSAELSAQNNFVQTGMSIPSFFAGSVLGADAGFVSYASGDLTPAVNSPLVNAGAPGSGPSSYEIPNPLVVPTFVPGARFVPSLAPIQRPSDGSPDIGAYEVASSVDPGEGGSAAGGSSGAGAGDPGTGGGSAGSGAGNQGDAGGSIDGGGQGGGQSGGDPAGGDDTAGGDSSGGGITIPNTGGCDASGRSVGFPGTMGFVAMLGLLAAARRKRGARC